MCGPSMQDARIYETYTAELSRYDQSARAQKVCEYCEMVNREGGETI